jgi:hypothetical protein
MELIDPPPVEIDTAQVMRTLRDAVGGRSACDETGRGVGSSSSTARWNRIYAQLTEAERHAAIGSAVPAMARFHRVIRPLARAMAVCVLYGGRFVFTPQRLFNMALLRMVRSLADCLREADSRLAMAEARIEKLERALVEQANRIDTLDGANTDNARLTVKQPTDWTASNHSAPRRAAG